MKQYALISDYINDKSAQRIPPSNLKDDLEEP